MDDRSQLIDRLHRSADSRASYIRGKINVLVPAQLHALRLKRGWTQKQFAQEADMKQSRVSAMEQPGAVNFNMETLIRSAATCGVGLVVKFVPFSEMLKWENDFDQDSFNPCEISEDILFLPPRTATLSADASQNFGSTIPTWNQMVTSKPFETVMKIASASDYQQGPPITEFIR